VPRGGQLLHSPRFNSTEAMSTQPRKRSRPTTPQYRPPSPQGLPPQLFFQACVTQRTRGAPNASEAVGPNHPRGGTANAENWPKPPHEHSRRSRRGSLTCGVYSATPLLGLCA
jgi:hypothetical protein